MARFGPKPKPASERLWKRMGKLPHYDECWPWVGTSSGKGYPSMGGHVYAHRVAYESYYGPVPHGLELDHVCRNRMCVNPHHLEAITHAENVRRAAAVRIACPHGHPWTEENTYWQPSSRGGNPARVCRTCQRDRQRARREAAHGNA